MSQCPLCSAADSRAGTVVARRRLQLPRRPFMLPKWKPTAGGRAERSTMAYWAAQARTVGLLRTVDTTRGSVVVLVENCHIIGDFRPGASALPVVTS